MNPSGNHKLERPLAGDETTLHALREHRLAWVAFAARAVCLIPALKAQMTAVTEETERATMDLVLNLRMLTTPEADASAHDKSARLSKIVMAMQFQDVTRQKLEHVGQVLDQWSRHLQALMKGPEDESGKQEIAALELVGQHYTMDEKRRFHAAALGPDYGEPVPIDMPDQESDSATIF